MVLDIHVWINEGVQNVNWFWRVFKEHISDCRQTAATVITTIIMIILHYSMYVALNFIHMKQFKALMPAQSLVQPPSAEAIPV